MKLQTKASFSNLPCKICCTVRTINFFPNNTVLINCRANWHFLYALHFVLWLINLLYCFATRMTQGKEPNQREMNVAGWFVYVRRCMPCNKRHSLFRYYVLYFPVQCQNLNRYRTKTNSSSNNRTLKWWSVMNNVSSGIFRQDSTEVIYSTVMRRRPSF